MQDHEYALLGGINRAQIGRYLSILSSAVSGVTVFLVLKAVDIAKKLDISVNLPPTALSLVGAGAVFAILYLLFNKYIWRLELVSNLLKVPNLSGKWNCSGTTLNDKGEAIYHWDGLVEICQTWDKIRVRLKTQTSGSYSIAAALTHDETEGFILLYNYKNEPKIGQPDLRAHIGCASITFSKCLESGHGEYFNGYGRSNFGTMSLRRAK
ncbi:TPA: hypothetical protein ACXI1V_003027 [Pseudomonas aeruginosa]